MLGTDIMGMTRGRVGYKRLFGNHAAIKSHFRVASSLSSMTDIIQCTLTCPHMMNYQ